MDYICSGFRNNSPSHNFRSLLSVTFIVICLSSTSWAASHTDPNTGVTGPCRKKESCRPGAKFGHPEDCSSFFVCKPEGKGYDVDSCPTGEQFDNTDKQCKVSSVKCAGPCQRNNKKKKKQPNPSKSEPTLKLNSLNVNSTESRAKNKDVLKKSDHPNTLGDNTEGTDAQRVLQDKSDLHGPHLLSGANTSHNLSDNGSSIVTRDKDKNVVTDPVVLPSTEPTLVVTSQQVPIPTTSSNKMPEKSGAPEVELPDDATPDPPYDVLTDENSAALNGSNGADDESKTDPAIIAGASIAVILLVILIIILLVFLFKRRRFKKGHDIEKIENPQYQKEDVDTQYRFSRDSTLYVGNTVDLKKKNNSPKKESSPDKRKRTPPPRPPLPTPSPKSKAKRNKKDKRKAPPPPNPFGEGDDLEEASNRDMFEKDSNGSSDIEMTTFTARNESADIPSIDGEETSPSDPLLKNNLIPPEKPPRLSLSPRNAKIVQQKLSEISSSSDSEESDEEKQTLTNPDTAASDDYDKKNNPFFDDKVVEN